MSDLHKILPRANKSLQAFTLISISILFLNFSILIVYDNTIYECGEGNIVVYYPVSYCTLV